MQNSFITLFAFFIALVFTQSQCPQGGTYDIITNGQQTWYCPTTNGNSLSSSSCTCQGGSPCTPCTPASSQNNSQSGVRTISFGNSNNTNVNDNGNSTKTGTASFDKPQVWILNAVLFGIIMFLV